MPPLGTATLEDVLRLDAREDRLCELVDGVLVEKTVGWYESLIAVIVAREMSGYAEETRVDREGMLDGGQVLPGSKLMLRELFDEADQTGPSSARS